MSVRCWVFTDAPLRSRLLILILRRTTDGGVRRLRLFLVTAGLDSTGVIFFLYLDPNLAIELLIDLVDLVAEHLSSMVLASDKLNIKTI